MKSVLPVLLALASPWLFVNGAAFLIPSPFDKPLHKIRRSANAKLIRWAKVFYPKAKAGLRAVTVWSWKAVKVIATVAVPLAQGKALDLKRKAMLRANKKAAQRPVSQPRPPFPPGP